MRDGTTVCTRQIFQSDSFFGGVLSGALQRLPFGTVPHEIPLTWLFPPLFWVVTVTDSSAPHHSPSSFLLLELLYPSRQGAHISSMRNTPLASKSTECRPVFLLSPPPKHPVTQSLPFPGVSTQFPGPPPVGVTCQALWV